MDEIFLWLVSTRSDEGKEVGIPAGSHGVPDTPRMFPRSWVSTPIFVPCRTVHEHCRNNFPFGGHLSSFQSELD